MNVVQAGIAEVQQITVTTFPITLSFNGGAQSASIASGDTAATVMSGALATAATQASPVGAYPITQGTLAANGNYEATFVFGP